MLFFYRFSHKKSESLREWTEEEYTHIPEEKAIHSNQVCFERVALQAVPTGLAAEEHSEVTYIVS